MDVFTLAVPANQLNRFSARRRLGAGVAMQLLCVSPPIVGIRAPVDPIGGADISLARLPVDPHVANAGIEGGGVFRRVGG